MRVIPTTQPRRRPRQARAQATVGAIIRATATVLVEQGYTRASTNRVAQVAGVSIGSLYQYFPSKEALVAALVEDHAQRMGDALASSLTASPPALLADRARQLVAGMIAAYRIDPQLHHVLCQEVPKVGELRRIYSFEQRLTEICRDHLFSAGERLRPIDIDRAVFLLVNALPSVIRAAIQADPSADHDPMLAEELTDMSVRYLAAA